MQVLSLFRRQRPLLTTFAVVALFAAACSGGARPTLTGDRLVETTETNVDGAAQPAVATVTPTDPVPAESAVPEPAQPTPSLAPGEVEQLVVELIETLPHDAAAFTQGLELHNGLFVESTGSRGPDGTEVPSTLRRVDPATGAVTQSVTLDQRYFGEGLTKVGDELIQLTWQENTAFYWNAETFELNKEVSYAGEGWGLCYDGSQLIMTDGTPELIFRDPGTFEETGRVPVTLNGQDVFNLNEAECVGGVVWANIWQSNIIVRIDPSTGNVTGVVDAFALDRPEAAAAFNGIAWDESTQSFYVTGKLWPSMYRVSFVPTPTG